jgi:hypothetical protein
MEGEGRERREREQKYGNKIDNIFEREHYDINQIN